MDLRAWPREEAMEEALARRLERGEACALGVGDTTWDALLDRVLREAGVAARPLDGVVARLALRRACARAARGTVLEAVVATRGFLAGAARFVAECERTGLDPAEATRAARALTGAIGLRVRVLADAYARFARATVAHGAQAARRRALATAALSGSGPLFLDGAKVTIKPRLVWAPGDAEAVLALAARATLVRVELAYAPGRPAVHGGLEPVLRAFEARPDLQALEPVLVDPGESETASIEILVAPTPEGELAAIAARARALVDGGVAPEEIVVAARTPAVVSRGLAAALARVGLRLDDRRGPSLASSPPARLALALIELAERGFPREEALAVIASGYVAPPGDGPPASRIARIARSLGVRELDPGRADGGVARVKATRGDGQRAAERLRELLAPVAALPERALLAEHARALRGVLDLLGVGERARAFDPALAGETGAARGFERALARDQAAARTLEDLLDGIGAAARAAGWAEEQVGRGELAIILADLMAEIPLRQIGARGGAIKLIHLEDLAARSFEHVFVPRLVEGEAPARSLDDGVWGERERRALDGALGRRLLATGTGDGEGERTPFELALLWQALAAARGGVTLSHPLVEDGRALARSPFLDEVLRQRPGLVPRVLPLSPVPPLDDVRAPADLLARIALELRADPAGRLPGTRADHGAVTAARAALAQAAEPRLARVEALAAIEHSRWEFFSGAAPAGPHVGIVDGGAAARVGGTASHPLAARQLDRFANCPFTFFAGRVLGVDLEEEAGDAPTQRRLGLVAHRCLEGFYRARATAGALPVRADDADRTAFDAACDEAFVSAERDGLPGHAALWDIEKARIREVLWRWIVVEAGGTKWGGVPAYFELPFGLAVEGSLPALVVGEGADAVHVGGRIDRVDVLPGGAGVVAVDYKLGRIEPNAEKVRAEAAANTALQLPIYAAAARAGLAARGVLQPDATADGAFVSLRDAKATRTLSHALGDGVVERVETRISELAARMRAGAFVIAPVDCKRCEYRTVCRVVALREEDAA